MTHKANVVKIMAAIAVLKNQTTPIRDKRDLLVETVKNYKATKIGSRDRSTDELEPLLLALLDQVATEVHSLSFILPGLGTGIQGCLWIAALFFLTIVVRGPICGPRSSESKGSRPGR